MNTDNLFSNAKKVIESRQVEKLQALINFLKHESENRFYQEKLHGIDAEQIQSLADLPKLSFTLKSELVAEQNTYPPFGRNLSYPLSRYTKYHQTSGTTGRPLKILDTPESWDWWARCWVQVYQSAGVTAADRVFMAFSFGPFIGFWAAYEAANHIGALTFPGGGMETEQRLAAILENAITVLCCTPSYAIHMAEVAAHKKINLHNSAVKTLILAGEPGASIPTVKNRIEQAWDAICYDHSGATEVGAWGFGCSKQHGLHVNEGEFIVEVLDRETGKPVAPGETGELIITNLGRWSFPVIRYRTGDVVKIAQEPCACGSSYVLFEGGIIGRTDNMVTIRGVNIFPSSVEVIIREVLESAEFRIVFYRDEGLDQIEVVVEIAENEQAVIEELATLFRQRLALRVPVKPVPADSLPRFQLKARRVVDKRFSDDN
jgi:phenylacetate-CoA ligase